MRETLSLQKSEHRATEVPLTLLVDCGWEDIATVRLLDFVLEMSRRKINACGKKDGSKSEDVRIAAKL